MSLQEIQSGTVTESETPLNGERKNEDAEQQELLTATHRRSSKGTASVVGSTINLLNSIIGVGVMTLPYSLQTDGYALGFVLFVLCAVFAHVAFDYLAAAADFSGHFAYKDIAQDIFGHRAWGWVVSIIMIVYVSGSLSSYTVAIMDNMYWWPGDENKKSRLLLCMAIMIAIVFPLSCLKNLDFMRFNSYVTLVCETVICTVIVCFFFIFDEPHESPAAFKFSSNSLSTLPLISASMCGHFATPYIYKELKQRSQEKMGSIIMLSALVLMIFYLPIMFFGYFTFTDLLHSNVLKTIAIYAPGAWYLKMVNVLMLVLIVCHFPVTCFGCRAAIESFFWKPHQAPLAGSVLIVLVIIVVLMGISFFVTEIADILDVTSSLAGSFVIFVIPAMFQIVIGRKQRLNWKAFVVPGAMTALGACNLVLGFASTVIRWLQ